LDEIAVGINLNEALNRMVDRVRSYDMDLLVTAIAINTQVGGNLAELLDTIGETIRERFRTRAEVAALTAEGRLSGVVLFFMPPALLAFLSFKSWDYIRLLFVEKTGQYMLGGAVVLQLVGGFVIYKMTAIDQ